MINPQMLTLLRESRGLSGAKLAELSQIPQPTLSKMENGLAPLDPARLMQIAEVLDYPIEAFAWTDPVYGFGHAAFYHRKQQALPQTTLRKIQANVNLTRIRLERLLRSIVVDAEYPVPVLDGVEFGGPAGAARAVRAQWRIPMGPIEDMMAVIERAGIIVVRTSLESPKISAISIDAIGTYPPLILLNTGMSADRERFTLAHELAHLVLHSAVAAPDEAEDEANSFASEFLMPAAEIRVQLKGITLERAAQLKRVWKVAMSAIIRRARDLGTIDETRYRSLNVSISQKGWRKVEPVEIPRDEPSIVTALVDVHLREHGYTVEELAQVVALSSAEFGARFDVAPLPPKREVGASRSHLRAVL